MSPPHSLLLLLFLCLSFGERVSLYSLTSTHPGAQALFQVSQIFLHQPPKCWHPRHVPRCPIASLFFLHPSRVPFLRWEGWTLSAHLLPWLSHPVFCGQDFFRQPGLCASFLLFLTAWCLHPDLQVVFVSASLCVVCGLYVLAGDRVFCSPGWLQIAAILLQTPKY